MTGLEKIIDKIKNDSEKNAEETLLKAEETKKEILKNAEAVALSTAEEIKTLANEKSEQIITRAKSSAQLAGQRNILYAKRKIINDVIVEAKQKLLSLPDEEYFEFIKQLLEKNKCSGEIVLCKKDKQRLPKDFELMGLSLSEKDGEFDGGFILINGDVEINCTVSALFDGAFEELSDKVNEVLFRGV